MIKLTQQYAKNRQVAQQLQQCVDTYKAAHQKIKKLLTGPKKEDLAYAFLNLFLECTTKAERLHRFDDFYDLIHDKTDIIFANCCFLDKILTTIKSVPCLSVIVGGAHAVNLTQHLTSLGFTMVSQVNRLAFTYPSLSQIARIETFDQDLIRSTKKLLEPLQKKLTAMQCHQCLKKPGIHQCSQCKTGRYCSADCQKAHWKTHKEVCKEPGSNSNN